MIHYETGKFAVSYICNPHLWKGSVAGKAFVWAAFSAGISFVLWHYIVPVNTGEDLGRASWSRDAKAVITVHTFILGTIMAFRVNQAFSRYWECVTRVLQVKSRWLNAVSTAFTLCSRDEGEQDKVEKFKQTTVRFVSMLFCAALNQLEQKQQRKEIINNEGMDVESLRFLDEAPDRVEILIQWMHSLTRSAQMDGTLDPEPAWVSRIYQELGCGFFELVHVRKILDAPIPYPYAHLLTILVLVHCVTTTLAAPYVFEHVTAACAAAFISVFAYMGAYYLAHSIERPFGDGMNDLPWDEYAKEMNRSLSALLDERAMIPPAIDFTRVKSQITVRECLSFVGDSQNDHEVCGQHFSDGEGGQTARALIVPDSACWPLDSQITTNGAMGRERSSSVFSDLERLGVRVVRGPAGGSRSRAGSGGSGSQYLCSQACAEFYNNSRPGSAGSLSSEISNCSNSPHPGSSMAPTQSERPTEASFGSSPSTGARSVVTLPASGLSARCRLWRRERRRRKAATLEMASAAIDEGSCATRPPPAGDSSPTEPRGTPLVEGAVYEASTEMVLFFQQEEAAEAAAAAAWASEGVPPKRFPTGAASGSLRRSAGSRSLQPAPCSSPRRHPQSKTVALACNGLCGPKGHPDGELGACSGRAPRSPRAPEVAGAAPVASWEVGRPEAPPASSSSASSSAQPLLPFSMPPLLPV